MVNTNAVRKELRLLWHIIRIQIDCVLLAHDKVSNAQKMFILIYVLFPLFRSDKFDISYIMVYKWNVPSRRTTWYHGVPVAWT